MARKAFHSGGAAKLQVILKAHNSPDVGGSQAESVLGLQCISREQFQKKKTPSELQLFRGLGFVDVRG